jgi:hypothetical protein
LLDLVEEPFDEISRTIRTDADRVFWDFVSVEYPPGAPAGV